LVCAEAASPDCRQLLRSVSGIILWTLTPVEIVSALTRRRRDGAMSPDDFATAKHRLSRLEAAWSDVLQVDAVKGRARRLLESHPLRAVDSLQLAAALVATEERPETIPFVTFDERLAEAARREGFTVLP
jgi:predicted nucleic acid-binding protein